MAKLTPKQKTFADEYLIDLNATQAYLRAGYKVSEPVAAVNGSKLLRNTKVQEYLQKRQKSLEKRTEITQERVLKELAAIAFANGIDYIKTFSMDIKLADKIKALELLGRHLGIFDGKPQNPDQDDDDNLYQAIGEAVSKREI